MQTVLRSADDEPMIEMNTTPLIDVMLVLLIMFIITIPMQSHSVKFDLPGPVPAAVISPIKNKVVVTRGDQILWNGTPVSMPDLRTQLLLTARINPQPELQLQPDGAARYSRVDEVLAETKRANVTRLGFVGNEQYNAF
ncbi:MAG: ExbD/TolR family protein [Sphingomicrobium sp.]